jgi:hypothetical protein
MLKVPNAVKFSKMFRCTEMLQNAAKCSNYSNCSKTLQNASKRPNARNVPKCCKMLQSAYAKSSVIRGSYTRIV